MADEVYRYYVPFLYQSGTGWAADYFISTGLIETPEDIEALRVEALNVLSDHHTSYNRQSIVILPWKRIN